MSTFKDANFTESDYLTRGDLPLPPLATHMQLAKPEQFMPETADSYQPIPFSQQFLMRATDIERLSGGAVGVTCVRAVPGAPHTPSPWHWHEWGMQIAYVTKGWAVYEFEGIDGPIKVEAGMLLFQPAHNRHRELEASDDFEGLEITFPAKTKTTFLIPDEANAEYKEMTIES